MSTFYRLRRSLHLRALLILWFLVMAVIFFGSSSPNSTSRSSAQAQVHATVIQALSISKTTDLDFGTLVQGSGESSVTPGPQGGQGAASFSVQGEPGRGFSIDLPDDQSVVLITGSGDLPTKRIQLYRFQSYPTPSNGLLSDEGSQQVSVGATRAASLEDQVPGTYSGQFTITVVY